jgi:hypothetical protein
VKKFSKLILEKKREKWARHPLVNPVDWDDIIYPFIEHILENLKEDEMLGDNVFSSQTKGRLDELVDSITEDYVQYYQDSIDDGSQDSFLDAYDINCKFEDIIDCTQHLRDKSKEIDEWSSWDGGYYQMVFARLDYKTTDEVVSDIDDLWGKLKSLPISFKILCCSKNQGFYITEKDDNRDRIESGIKNMLEKPLVDPKNWIRELTGIEIYIFNKSTVQAVDL